MLTAIVSWPRSGQCWLARLLNRAADIPYVTLLPQDEGRDVVENVVPLEGRNWRLVRAHGWGHEHREAAERLVGNAPQKFIHLVRDPRAVVVSNALYFDHRDPLEQRIKEAMKQVANGWEKLNLDLQKTAAVQVRYEDLIRKPVKELNRIVLSLGLCPPMERLKEVVRSQEWDRKVAAVEAGRPQSHGWTKRQARRNLGRGPASGSWREVLDDLQSELLRSRCGHAMGTFGYGAR